MPLDLHLVDPSEVPVPPDEVRIRELSVEPLPDGRRVRVSLDLTPFQQPPTLDLVVTGDSGVEAASTTIVEPFAPKMSLTMHLQEPDPDGKYSLRVDLVYPDGPAPDSRETSFHTV